MTLTVTLRDLVHGDDTDIRILRPSNLWEAPDLRVSDTELPGSHGGLAGTDLHGMRRITLTARISKHTRAEALARANDVIAAWAPSLEDVELAFTDDTGDYLMFGRPRQAAPIVANLGVGVIHFECRFAATDPFRYSAVEHVTGTPAPTPPAGRTYNLTFPRTYGAAGTSGAMQITNAGNAPAPWQAAIIGPCSEPRLIGEDGQIVYGDDLAAGEILELDSRARTVLLGGVSSRYALLTEFGWFTLPPGGSEVRFSTADGQGAVFFAHRDTWW